MGNSKSSEALFLTDEEKVEFSGCHWPFENFVVEGGGAKCIGAIGTTSIRVSFLSCKSYIFEISNFSGLDVAICLDTYNTIGYSGPVRASNQTSQSVVSFLISNGSLSFATLSKFCFGCTNYSFTVEYFMCCNYPIENNTSGRVHCGNVFSTLKPMRQFIACQKLSKSIFLPI